MLSPELIQKANLIFLKSRHKVSDIFSGEFASAFRGRGIEFEEFREYMPGDDVRQIDWNVTARSNKPHIKTFREEREQTVFFVVDFSRSLDFGKNKTKRELITELSALLAYATVKSGDKVGLITFTDCIEKFLPAQKGKSHVWQIVSELLSQNTKSIGTDITKALKYFLQMQKRRSICFLISDFLTPPDFEILKTVNFRHDLVCVRCLDSTETVSKENALVDFADLETDQTLCLDLGKNLSGQHLKALPDFLQKNGIDFLDLQIDLDPVEALIRFFIQREKKR